MKLIELRDLRRKKVQYVTGKPPYEDTKTFYLLKQNYDDYLKQVKEIKEIEKQKAIQRQCPYILL